MKKSIDDLFIKGFYVYPIFGNCGAYRFVLASTGQQSPDELASYLIPGLTELYKGEFYLAVGNSVQELSLLSNSMKEAKKALEYRYFSPSGNILYYRDLKNWTINYDFNGIKNMEELLSSFESLDQTRLINSIKSSFKMFISTLIAPEIVGIYLANVINKSFSIISNMGGVIDEIAEIPSLSKLMDKSLSINQIEKLIEQYAIGFCNYTHSLKNKDKKSDKQKVEEYIQLNFKRNLTIREISGKLYLHPTYLGCQINKWFGCSCTEYLHKLRMEEAKRLVTDTELRVHEIAYSLGYTSYNNFLKQFVKYYSIKPTEYRNKVKDKAF
jgi:two-component system response regulator YesN